MLVTWGVRLHAYLRVGSAVQQWVGSKSMPQYSGRGPGDKVPPKLKPFGQLISYDVLENEYTTK